jgi:hypothetical protein
LFGLNSNLILRLIAAQAADDALSFHQVIRGQALATEHTMNCDCCEETVQHVNEHGFCFACDVYLGIMVRLEEKFCEEHAHEMAEDIHEWVMSCLLERFTLPGQEHPLAKELHNNSRTVETVS